MLTRLTPRPEDDFEKALGLDSEGSSGGFLEMPMDIVREAIVFPW
jgi:hypothetical protein